MQDANFDVLGWLAKDLGRSSGRVVDTDLIVGTATAEPLGCMIALAGGGAGSVTTGGSFINPTYETLVDVLYGVNDEYRSSGNAAWLMRDSTAGVVRKIRDGSAAQSARRCDSRR